MSNPGYDHDSFQYITSASRGGEINIVTSKRKQTDLNLDIEALADKLWEKIYSKPSIIPCPYCKSHNAVTNPTCVQCGGPLGA